MKNAISEMKNTLERIKSRLDEAEDRIGDWKTRQKKTPNQNNKEKMT